MEIAEQVDNIDAVVIPVGGGGLIAGCAVAFKALHPHIEVIVSSSFVSYKCYNTPNTHVY